MFIFKKESNYEPVLPVAISVEGNVRYHTQSSRCDYTLIWYRETKKQDSLKLEKLTLNKSRQCECTLSTCMRDIVLYDN